MRVYISTNGDKVCRIMVCDVNLVDERSIQIRFNKLCRQFEENSKYLTLDDYRISDDEDISYGITIKKKRYEAIFYQKPAEILDTLLVQEKLLPKLMEKYTPEQIANPTEEIKTELLRISYEYATKKPVWFMISDYHGEYYITMFYDNEYNRADGEDL